MNAETLASKTVNDYMVQPVLDIIRNEDKCSPETLKVIVGPLGGGKTTHTLNTFIPALFEQGVKVVLYTTPFTEIIDSKFLEAANENRYQLYDSIEKAQETSNSLRKKGKDIKNVLIALTVAGAFYEESRRDKTLDFLKSFGKNEVAIFFDEASLGTTSTCYNLPENMGGDINHNYKATIYNCCQILSGITRHTYGITATPTAEIRGELELGGSLQYKVINDMPPTKNMHQQIACLGNVTQFNMECDESLKKVITKSLINQIKYYHQKGSKKTLTLWVQDNRVLNNSSYSRRTIGNVVKLVQESMQKINFGCEGDNVICTMTSDKCYEYSRSGDNKREVSEGELRNKLSNADDPLQVCILVMKGRMGFDVSTIKNLIIVRPSNKNNGNTPIIENPLQQLGRAARINISDHYRNWCLSKGYEDYMIHQEYWDTASYEDRKELEELNTINVSYPYRNPMWDKTLSDFEKYYVDLAEDWRDLKNGKSDEDLCSHCVAFAKLI